MNLFKEKFKDKYGSIEPYLALKLEVVILLTLIVTIAGKMVNPYLYILQAFTLIILFITLYQVKKNFPEKLLKYSMIFTILYAVSIAVPFLLMDYATPMTPTGINTVLFILIGVLVLFIGLRAVTSRKGVRAEVLLSNEEIAVIQPEYDLVSGVKPSKYVVNNKGAEEGDEVQVKLSKTPFKKPRPKKIEEVVK